MTLGMVKQSVSASLGFGGSRLVGETEVQLNGLKICSGVGMVGGLVVLPEHTSFTLAIISSQSVSICTW